MPTLHHTEIIPLPSFTLYEIITDVEKYPEFLPWCLTAELLEKSETHMIADLCIGVSSFKGTFRSAVSLTPFSKVEVHYGDTSQKTPAYNIPFKHLYTRWSLKELAPQETSVEFYIDFSFQSWILNKMMARVFDQACHTMIKAFKKRSYTHG
ncbi:MAG: type II toxin-antitoxin system RatA family toxin [Proteobacteria bacterium]|nr:type II toxin-antitoxin system RatA family toxin [Pseudomonadota bacterium]